MPPRIYEDVFIDSSVYCSSSGDYFVRVTPIGNNGYFQTRQYLISAQCFVIGESMVDRPKYLFAMIKEALRAKTDLCIFEYDRDGRRRYEPLRYGNINELMEMIQR